MKLYEIDDAIELILAQSVDTETGEIMEEALEELEKLEMDRDRKALAVARYLLGERAEGDAVNLQADRLRDRALRHHARADRLERYLQSHLPAGHALRDDVAEIKWSRSQSVEVDEGAHLPDEYIRRKVTASPNKVALGAALKLGKQIRGARLVKRISMKVR